MFVFQTRFTEAETFLEMNSVFCEFFFNFNGFL